MRVTTGISPHLPPNPPPGGYQTEHCVLFWVSTPTAKPLPARSLEPSMYALGIDLGTTFTAAATWRDGRADVAPLGSRTAAIPSVVLLREDETMLTGETATRRALSEPHRVAREFKRRLGDTTPIMLAGVPYSAEALTGRLLRAVVEEVVTREGGAPASICVSHPANWGEYKIDLLRQSLRIADLTQPVSLITEPEAAAVFYAQQQRVDPGSTIAVYDLGGGTFDAAVLRKGEVGFTLLGQPEGIERLGGIDFDAAVFGHVARALGGALEDLDEDDPTVITAVSRLREECTDAKEALSSDTDVTIPVLLPNLSTEVRLTRGELEAMVRPALHDSIDALRRALRSAGVSPEQLHSVLLVGGSSRMPLVAQLVGAELGRPVAVDAHPKHAVALGAAWWASGTVGAQAPVARPEAAPPTSFVSTGTGSTPSAPVGASVPPVSLRPAAAATGAAAAAAGVAAAAAATPAAAAAAASAASPASSSLPFPPTPADRTEFIATSPGLGRATPATPMAPILTSPAGRVAETGTNRMRVLGGTIVALVIVLGGLATANALMGGTGSGGQQPDSPSVSVSAGTGPSAAAASTAPVGPTTAGGQGVVGGAGQGAGGAGSTKKNTHTTTHASATPTRTLTSPSPTPTPTWEPPTPTPTSDPTPTPSQVAPTPTRTRVPPVSLPAVTLKAVR